MCGVCLRSSVRTLVVLELGLDGRDGISKVRAGQDGLVVRTPHEESLCLAPESIGREDV